MNLDELAKNVMSGEEGLQFMQNPSSNSMFLENTNHGTLCNKSSTVDENHNQEIKHYSLQPQLSSTLGLEDFLIRANVIKNRNKFDDQPQMEPKFYQQINDMMMPMPIQCYSDIGFENHQSMDVVNNYSEKTTNMAMTTVTTSNDCYLSGERKRTFANEKMEKNIERRQRRMIKNRESAARSRARKQAYTKQLEQEVLELRNTNNWLKKQKVTHSNFLGLY
ncbi:uncharacterized protein LOC107818674 [Nicotiana tabacum]|uniref:uncharacterized protein LOC107818674 n=1 Tax=Nicotiana tabacum TaxID=4097 RepID=UPI001445A1AE|nr:ABSCISIC ACID-INSENSITIVE 5-like protein 2 [Nicotiana tomentosiformis]